MRAWECEHGVDGRDPCYDCFESPSIPSIGKVVGYYILVPKEIMEKLNHIVQAAEAVNFDDVIACVTSCADDPKEPQRYRKAYATALVRVHVLSVAVDEYKKAIDND
jgi:hypothetical protein